jgi:hypothetical protein
MPSTPDVAAQTGASFRQLDYWIRTGRIPGMDPDGKGSGVTREWTPAAVAHADRMARLTRAGLAVDIAHQLAVDGPGTYRLAAGVHLTLTDVDVFPAGDASRAVVDWQTNPLRKDTE